MATDTAKSLLQDMHIAGQQYEAGDQDSRGKILELCKQLTSELEQPGETFMRINWAEPTRSIALRVALDLDVFKTLSESDESPKTSAQLAAPKNADPVLVARVMRNLAAMSSVREVGPDLYVHTRFSRALVTNPGVDAFKYIHDDYGKVWLATPRWLAERGWKSPEDARDTPAAFVWDAPNTTLFEFFAQHPDKAEKFGAMMTFQASGKTMWADEGAYPVAERLGDAQEEDVLVVDIGGGVGHDLLGFKERHPHLKGRLVLAELPHVIDQVAGTLEGIELVKHDFYTLQPIKGAHAYFLHQILHDYSDDTCRKILEQIKPAMQPGRSRILINELVLPNQGAHWITTGLDWGLLTCLAARERTEKEFRDLFASVGLAVQGIWKHPQGYDSVIELTLPDCW